MRAGSELLLSADGKTDGASTLDSAEPLAQLAQAESRLTALAQSAHGHQTRLSAEPAADQLPVAQQLQRSQAMLGTTQSATPAAAHPTPHTPTPAGALGEGLSSLSFLPDLQRNLVVVISKYVKINPQGIKVGLQKQGNYALIEVNIVLPEIR